MSLANDEGLNQCLEKAASHLEAEFITSNDVRETLSKCEDFETTCTAVDIDKIDILPVSYTHLTLPTILLV